MNLQEWQAAIFSSALSPSARLVALTMGTFGSWNKDSTVEPGITRLCLMTGLSDKTVKKYRQEVIDAGYLKDTGRKAKNNTTVYELTCPESIQAKEIKQIHPSSLDNLKKAPNHQVPETFHNLRAKRRNSQVPETFHNLDDSQTAPEKLGSGNGDSQVPETGSLGSGNLPYEHKDNIKTNIKDTTTNKLVVVESSDSSKLGIVEDSAVATAPVHTTSLNFQDDDTSSNPSNEATTTEAAGPVVNQNHTDFLKLVEDHEFVREQPFSKEVKDLALSYYLNPKWEKTLKWASREIEAIHQAELDLRETDEIEW